MAAASGIPGVPPPLPTSTTGPSTRRTSSTPARASSSNTRLASAGARRAVSPGASSTASSQRSRSLDVDVARVDDDEAVGLGAFARRLDLRIVLQLLVHDLPLDGGHRLELDALPGRGCLL